MNGPPPSEYTIPSQLDTLLSAVADTVVQSSAILSQLDTQVCVWGGARMR